MRLRAVCLTVISLSMLPVAGWCAATEQSPQTMEAQQAQRIWAKAPLTSPEERAALHGSSEWALIAPHLPDPDTASAAELEFAADVLVARRFPEDALDYYGYAMMHNGNVSNLLNKMGIVRLELRQNEIAREMFRRTVHVQKKNAPAWNNLGVTEYQEKNYSSAISDYKKASKLDGKSAVYHSNLGIAYFETRDLVGAQQQFAIALQLNPHVLDPQDGFGAMAQVIGNEDFGGLCFQMAKVFAHERRDAEMQRWLAKASEAGFDVRHGMQADNDLRTYLKDPQVKMILATADLMHKKPSGANVASLGKATQP
jgi:Flp pilus assembly protein TadD